MPEPLKTRSMTEGAMLAAITVVLALLGVYFFGYLLFITPVPIAVLVYRHGLRAGILVAVTASIVSGFFGTMVTTVIFLLVIGLVGVAIGEGLRENFSAAKVMVIGSGVSVLALVLLTGVAMLFFGPDLIDRTFQMLQESFEQAFSVYERMGIDTGQALGGMSLDRLMQILRMTLPAAVAISGIGLTFVNYALTRMILIRLNVKDLPWFTPFRNWRSPLYLAWGFILGKALLLITQLSGNQFFLSIGLNIEILFNYVFLIQGLAIAWWFFDKWRLNKPVRVLLVFFAINPTFSTLITFLGVLDTWFDFRKLGQQENK